MLVLTRKIGQRIRIGDDVWVQVTEVNRGSVKLGFVAPPEVRIEREERVKRNKHEEESE